MALRRFREHSPRVHPSCFIEDSAQVVGDVELGEDSSVWFNTVLRGDVNAIRIGQRTNIQDLPWSTSPATASPRPLATT